MCPASFVPAVKGLENRAHPTCHNGMCDAFNNTQVAKSLLITGRHAQGWQPTIKITLLAFLSRRTAVLQSDWCLERHAGCARFPLIILLFLSRRGWQTRLDTMFNCIPG